MATFALVIGLAALLATSSAQSNNERVWSSVAFIYHGETTPARGVYTTRSITPIGAHQMFAQGSVFRARYLVDGNTTGETVDHATIQGVEPLAIDGSQTSVITTNDGYISTSAMAFMQGLYPPVDLAVANSAGGLRAAALANGTVIDYPLNGYQYPDINTLSTLDPDFIWINGKATCSNYYASILNFTDDPWAQQLHDQTLPFYQRLWHGIFAGAFPLSMASFFYATDLYEYAAYQYAHDNSTHSQMNQVDLAMLALYAGIQQRDLNGNLSASGGGDGDMIRAIAGRTLAAKVLSYLKLNMASKGSSNKLNLMVGPFDPMIAFFALAGLVDGPSADNFQTIPNPGSAMVFELFSNGGNGSYPAMREMWVRFLYRNSSLPGARFVEYSLFGNGNSRSTLRFNDFASGMQGISLDGVSSWCNTCGSINLFCSGLTSNSGGYPGSPATSGGSGSDSNYNDNSNKIDPVVAGVIGAAVTCGVAGLVLLASILLGFVRLSSSRDRRNSSSLGGGFKGADKMTSDNDLSYAKGGVRHERTGSWELRNGGKGTEQGVTSVTDAGSGAAVVRSKDRVATSRTRSFDEERDDISVMGASPVEPRQGL
ncbi:histidine phosphatase superfamily [Coniochaeta sp. 2T2.1]|nr:histidine phosphatase superfamily [Coniochaeta sp. 2T2.1]